VEEEEKADILWVSKCLGSLGVEHPIEGGGKKQVDKRSITPVQRREKKRTQKRRKNCQLRKELKSKKKEIENKRMFHEEARGTVGTQQKKKKKKRKRSGVGGWVSS
jgi:hypothetical protein